MDWVAVSIGISKDPAVHRMAAALRVRVPEVVGLLTLAFAEMTAHAPDGQLGDVPDSLLEAWATWHGKRGRFAPEFRANLCDETGLVTAWEKYNGAAIRRANAARDRSRAWREQKQNATPTANDTPNGTHTETSSQTHTNEVRECGTGQDRTVPDRTTQQTAPPLAARSEWEEALAAQAGEHYPTIAAWLDARPADVRADWAKDLLQLIGPATGNTAADLARACTDGTLATPPVTNARTLRIFLAACREERVRGMGLRSSPSRSGPDTTRDDARTEAGNLVAQIRELAFDQAIPGQGSRRLLRNADVERIGEDVHAAYRTVGGAARFNAIDHKPDDLPFLIRDFAAALRTARDAQSTQSREVRSA